MKRLLFVLLMFLPLAVSPAGAADPFDGITLTLANGVEPGSVALQWTGGDPKFKVYRSARPSGIVAPGNQLGEIGQRTWADNPSGEDIFYYIVTSPCVYNPPEVCNGIDDDCDGAIPPDEADADGDGFAICQGDCDDTLAPVHPGQAEICDGLDNDCDGTIDDFATTCGVGACAATGSCFSGIDTCMPRLPGLEACNGIDDDCDGVVDDHGSEQSCVLPNTHPLCVQGSCSSYCLSGFSDCDAVQGNGCECPSPGCCGIACQVQHSSGLGQNFYDCLPLGIPGNPATYSEALATEAVVAWNPAIQIDPGTCTYPQPVGSIPVLFSINNQTHQCGVWAYTKTMAGRAFQSLDTECFCPTTTSPTWR